MNIFYDYQIINKIYSDNNYNIYKAIHQFEQNLVLIKAINTQFSDLETVSWLKNEYEILKTVTLPGIIQPYSLQKYNSNLGLVLEYFEGEYLESFLHDREFVQNDFFIIAIQIVNILQKLHGYQIIHKNIQPLSIFINPTTLQVKITNFSIATNFNTDNNIASKELRASNIAYISPEQTGRVNLSLDYRTDFYSLGIILYQMLTAQLPYCQALNYSELIHCHLAQTPITPHQINSDIPQTLSSVIMKLLAKNPEDRYQTAYGIKKDLEICRSQYQNREKIELFDIGKFDRCSQFTISPTLYNRSLEVNGITKSWEKATSGAVEMVVVKGNSGMGKTSIILKFIQTIVKQKGYFASGKFEQLTSNIPYSAIIQAFRDLLLQLLTESSHKLQIWREKILSVLGTNGKVITNILPELELIIGSQPDIPELPVKETENRFNIVLEKFVRVFLQSKYPIVLFLDDSQWIDSASVKLLELLLDSSNSEYLLVITAYRDNEVNSYHPLINFLDQIQEKININHISLQPLLLKDINQLLVDTLLCQEEHSLSLAKLLFDRSRGNPWFVHQLLQGLYVENLLTFNFSTWSWCWDMEKIMKTPIFSYSISELLVKNLEKLSDKCQQILKLAACVGNQFNLSILEIVCDQSQEEIAQELEIAVQVGIVIFVKEQEIRYYKFLGDYIQQTFYFLLDEEEKILTHLKIGQFLLQHTSPEEIEEKIFNLVNHLNQAIKLLSANCSEYHLAELNLIAGKKAKAATAYELAANYLDIALEITSLSDWKNNYNLILNIYIEAIEVQYLQTNFERAEELANQFLLQVDEILEKVRVYKIKIHDYIARNEMQLAIDMGLSILESLNIFLPYNLPETNYSQHKFSIKRDTLESFKTLPKMTDSNSMAAMEILAIIIPPVYIVKPQLFPIVALKMIDLCLKYGNSPLSPFAYLVYGLLLCGSGNIDAGYELGKLALKLQEKFDNKAIKSKVDFIFNNMIRHWREPAISTLEHFLKGVQDGIEVGDIEHACFHAKYYCTYIFFVGEPLVSANKKSLEQINTIQKFKQTFQLNYARIWRQLNLNLQGLAEEQLILVGDSFDEFKMIPWWKETNNSASLLGFYLAKLILCYLLKDYHGAVSNAREGKKYLAAAIGTMCFSVYYFYAALAMLALASDQGNIASEHLEEIVTYQEQIRIWTDHSPDNYLHKYELVSAEIARVLGKKDEALKHYDEAITQASKAGYIHEAALAEELAGEFYLSQGLTKIAGYYLTDAYYGYQSWGAFAKVQALAAKYPELLTTISSQSSNTNTINNNQIASLDLLSVIKASQAISSEIILDNLLSKMMEILLRNAGAQKSILFLRENSSWSIAAFATMTPKIQVYVSSLPITEYLNFAKSIVNYVKTTSKTVILEQASKQGIFTEDPYIIEHQLKSILAYPMIYHNQLQGIIYLENNAVRGAFTPQKLEILKVLLSQVSISIENARLYQNLENHTSVKKSLKQKEILLKEIHHRVKNNLFVVSSLLELQSSYIHDPQVIKLLGDCQNRIKSMALVHQHLYGNTELDRINFAKYIKSLIDNLASYNMIQEKNIEFILDLDNIELNIETANPCGLIINELVSNALEHGFPGWDPTVAAFADRGNIWLSLKQNIKGQKVLIIQDDGVGFPEELDLYNSDSLGLELVCSLVEQINGSIQLDKSNGTKIQIIFDELNYKRRI